MTEYERPHLSFSKLNALESCNEKFRLRYIERVPQAPSGAMIAGKVVHRTIEESEKESWWEDPETFYDAEMFKFDGAGTAFFFAEFDRELREAGGRDVIHWGGRKTKEFPDGEDDRWWRKMGPTMLRRYGGVRREDSPRGVQIMESSVEARVGMDLQEKCWTCADDERSAGDQERLCPTCKGKEEVSVRVDGYLDAGLIATGTGERGIRDYKTGRWTDEFQLATYSIMLRQMRDLDIRYGEFVDLRQNDPHKRIVPFDLSSMLPQVEPAYLRTGRQVDVLWETFGPDGPWPVNRSSFCKSCTVNHACWWGQKYVEDAAETGDGPSMDDAIRRTQNERR